MSEDPTRIQLSTDEATSRDPRVRRMHGTAVHGNVPFDVPFVSEIGENLWQGGCENGLFLPNIFKHLVSVYPWESYKIKHELTSYLAYQMYDSVDQSTEEVEVLARWVNLCRKTGPVLVHCQAGLNRSSLIVARALMLSSGCTGAEAIATLREKRSPACLCNPAFEMYVRSAIG